MTAKRRSDDPALVVFKNKLRVLVSSGAVCFEVYPKEEEEEENVQQQKICIPMKAQM